MKVGVLLDTCFLISLVDQQRTHHHTAVNYYRYMLEQQISMYFSAIVAAEFSVKQPVTDLPLKNFRVINFTVPHGVEAGRLLNMLEKDTDTSRIAVRDDYKLIAQAHHEAIPFLITEDAGTMHKYCQRLEKSGNVKTRALLLTEGFDAALLRLDGLRSNALGTLKAS
ncbi:MAG: hypothetical protein ORN28_03550 [Rhodoferax sp.]|nr:hypothetical protein [Rhodoferax sp.]